MSTPFPVFKIQFPRYLSSICLGLLLSCLFGCSKQTDSVTSPYQAGQHYQHYAGFSLTGLSRPLHAPSVVEFFSYGCMHCQKLAPQLDRWQKTQPGLDLQYLPIIWNQKSELYAKVFLLIRDHVNFATLHAAMFELTAGFMRTDSLEEQQVAFVQKLDELGIPAEVSIPALNGDSLAAKLNAILIDIKDFEITGVPSLIVNGKQKILNDKLSSNDELLQVAEFLLKHTPEINH